jgi:murein DD-endopeptidase MepM/ murein hydrolase activator NlpD
MKTGNRKRPYTVFLAAVSLLLATLACGEALDSAAGLSGKSYWTAVTGTPIPTVTIFLGTTTPVYPPTPIPGQVTLPPTWVTLPPLWMTVTATPNPPWVAPTATPFGWTATPFWITTTPGWATTTPVYITETPAPPWTTTPALPIIGFTTPVPTETPYYRVGTFYLDQDVYVGGPNGVVFNIQAFDAEPSPRSNDATYFYIDLLIKNHTGQNDLFIPFADLFFIRRVHQADGMLAGRWTVANEPLLHRNLPLAVERQELLFNDGEERAATLGFVIPNGAVSEVGVTTDWNRSIEGGVPIWFLLTPDPGPDAPYESAYKPPPPTPIIFDENDTYNPIPGGPPPPGLGLWPTNGYVTRGFSCQQFFTGVDGAGWGCPPEKPWFHTGVDIANVQNNPIWSPVAGAILYAGPNSAGPDCSAIPGSQPPHEGFGNYIRLSDGDTTHILAHLSGFLATHGGVTAGQQVATMGSTGCSTGPHLHWQMYRGGSLVDPAAWAGAGPPP